MSLFDKVLGALPVVGDMFSAMSQKDANEENIHYQKEFAQHGVRWRVEDAKAAGLHPLYALGGSGATFTPSSQSIDFGKMGQNLARAASAMSGDARATQAAQLRVLNAQAEKDEALAAAARSEEKRREQEYSQSRPVFPVAQSFPVRMPGQPDSGLGEINPDGSWVTPQPQELAKWERMPAYLAGSPKAGFREWEVPGLGRILLPDAENMAEALESLENPINQAFIVTANLEHYPHLKRPQLVARLRRYLDGKSRSRGLPPSILSPEGN